MNAPEGSAMRQLRWVWPEVRRVRHLFAKAVRAFYVVLGSSLGIWFLSTVVAGLAVYLYGERNQCNAVRDADFVAELKNELELRTMYGITCTRYTLQTLSMISNKLYFHLGLSEKHIYFRKIRISQKPRLRGSISSS